MKNMFESRREAESVPINIFLLTNYCLQRSATVCKACASRPVPCSARTVGPAPPGSSTLQNWRWALSQGRGRHLRMLYHKTIPCVRPSPPPRMLCRWQVGAAHV